MTDPADIAEHRKDAEYLSQRQKATEDTSVIEISFPVPVHITRDQQIRLDALVTEICAGYEARHPDRVMWAVGYGGKPMNLHDDDALDFDMSVLSIDCAERERHPTDRRHRIATLSRQEASGEVRVSAADAFEMGYVWAGMLTGQTLEDSRAVGRTLRSDIFEPIADRIDAIAKEEGYDSFKDAEHGIWAAKIIIKRALSAQPLADAGDVGRGREAWARLETWSKAETCCQEVKTNTVFADDVTEEYRRGVAAGADICLAHIRVTCSQDASAEPPLGSTAPDELRAEGDGEDPIARCIYASLHHLMRVTGTEAQKAYEQTARSIRALARPDRMAEMEGRLRRLHSAMADVMVLRRPSATLAQRQKAEAAIEVWREIDAALSASEGGR